MNMKKRNKIGLALGSGAVRGLAHVGAMRVLLENKIPIDTISGASIGAFVGAHWAMHQDIEALEDAMVGHKREKIRAFLDPSLKGGIVKGRKAEELMKMWFGNKSFKDLKIPFACAAADLRTGEEVVLKEGRLIPAILASMAMPPVFHPVKIGNHLLSDGGLANPVPDDLARQLGADRVISVALDSPPDPTKPAKEELSLAEVTRRSLIIIRNQLMHATLHDTDVLIEPHVELAGYGSWTKYFAKDQGEAVIRLGRQATQAKLSQIKQLLN